MSKPRSILLAVHGDTVRQRLHDFLQTAGLQTIKADNGVDALAAVMNFRPDGAVLTVQLPKIDGIRVAQLLRDVDELRDVRLLLVGPHEVEAKVLQKLQPALYCAVPELDKILAVLAQLELIPSVPAAAPVSDAPRASSPMGGTPPDRLQEAKELLDKGQPDGAFDILRTHTKSHPDDLKARGFLELCRTLLFR